jgi:predicted O-linked N-acetylglucosamine transferase (SPINDLY family)
MPNPELIQSALKYHQSGQFPEAESIYRQLLADDPKHADALHLLGVIAYQTGRHEEAVDLINRAIALNNKTGEYFRNLGLALASLRRFEPAAAAYREALKLRPNYPKCLNNLAGVLQHLNRLDDAIGAARRAVQLQPNYPDAWNGLGALFFTRGDAISAAASYREAIKHQPVYPQAYFNLGIAAQHMGKMDEAIIAYRKAVEQKPNYPEAWTNLGVCLKLTGQLDDGLAAYQKAVDLQPGNTVAHSNLIYLLQFHAGYGPAEIFAAQQDWERKHAEPLKALIKPHLNNRDPNRRIKIGYVSPDLRHHVVGSNLLPLLREHTHEQFEIICYAHVEKPDSMSLRLKSFADGWRDIRNLSDADAAELIRKDQIDILVDLTLHMADNKLLLFARKPAPVQVSYLGYCGGTGLKTIDYRISDPHMDPTEEDLKFYSETTVRLPNSYWCYQRPDPAPPQRPPPVVKNGFITFGCLNNFAKVTAPTMDVWSRVLLAVPKSKLIIHAQPGPHIQMTKDRFKSNGVDPERLEFVGKQAFWQYLQTFDRIDIVLDPFPYGGGITTCDGLWMGAPAITLSGTIAVGRGGRSILSNIGLGEWVAYTHDDYVRLAVDLASDVPRLEKLRDTMRERMLRSPMMDAKRFAKDVEEAYREMWRKYCACGEVGA